MGVVIEQLSDSVELCQNEAVCFIAEFEVVEFNGTRIEKKV